MTTADESAPAGQPANGTAAARARLARGLRDSGRAPSPAVQAAFLAVPRHLFVPGLAPAAAYQDEALVIKYDAAGLPVSSSSQPAMMAIMLEQLGLRPGHRVLEIGTGTGYNAAVMAHIVGPSGSVVTVDIDPELVGRAQASLIAAGYPQALANCADGGYGDSGHAPFDRVIVTAGAWDIAPAWLSQLAPGGRLVLPLAVRGIQLSVELRRAADQFAGRLTPGQLTPGQPGARQPAASQPAGDSWVSWSAFRCGFVRMAGAFADPEPFRPLDGLPGLHAQGDGGWLTDTGAVAAALAGPALEIGTGVAVISRDELADLDLWLTLTEPALSRLALIEMAPSPGRPGLLPFGGLTGGSDGQLAVGGLTGVRAVAPASPPGDSGALDLPGYPGEAMLAGYGPGGPVLAEYLARQARAWDGLGRPGLAQLRLTVGLPGADPRAVAGQLVLARPHVTIAAGWAAS